MNTQDLKRLKVMELIEAKHVTVAKRVAELVSDVEQAISILQTS